MFKGAQEDVWQVINDPDALRRALLGCKEFAPTGDGHYAVSLQLGFAFIKSLYTGSVKMSDVVTLHSYTLALSGKGPLGSARGEGRFTLEQSPGGDQTALRYTGSVEVAGSIARLGDRIIRAGAQLAIQQFFAALQREIARVSSDSERHENSGRLAASL